MNYKNTSYTVSIEFTMPVDTVFPQLIDLSKWWPEDYVGESIGPGSEFVLKIGDEHFSKNRVIEFIPDKKLAWMTTESIRRSDNYDWTGTKMIFELTPLGRGCSLSFTYDGVVLEEEQERLIQICDYCIRIKLYNLIESVKVTIEVARPRHEVFEIMTADVRNWWGGKDLTGKSTLLNDEFVIDHPGTHYSKQQLTEVIPGKKIVWQVTEGTLYWLKNDKNEWTNTRMIIELTDHGSGTIINFTHEGVVPGKECYEACRQGWNTVLKDYLFNYITYGKVAEQLYRMS
ncbi:MAG: SRPBCC domain-containing protein [Bacteroidetes bacterium]|nr:SRPBCC domain-containing protein [Bacteroidota bacterium]